MGIVLGIEFKNGRYEKNNDDDDDDDDDDHHHHHHHDNDDDDLWSPMQANGALRSPMEPYAVL